jgi:cellulose synthase/poly-beta-1,6-N-acetylglucosamine synthase-like glycosyltransferase
MGTVLLLTCSVAVLGYVYVGYPLLLRFLVWLRGSRRVERYDVTPRLSLLISAYNEAAVIRHKLENALSLDYPADQLEIVVVSDASDDGTDEIVREFAGRGVKLLRQSARRGKTAGLNAAVPHLTGVLVAFSDANAMYRTDALRMLARNFADPTVGCVTGEARYLPGGQAVADRGERAYWNYEMQVKRFETALGSMVGGDGAIYAIRKSLWRELPESAINDFLNPLQIVAAGWRAVYEPEAVCFEETAGGIAAEYRRRVRIVSRSWRAIFQAPGVLNPFKVGVFAWCVVSHKMLRWLSGAFAASALVCAAIGYTRLAGTWPVQMATLTATVAAGVVCTAIGRRVVALVAYFYVITTASLVGLFKGTFGRVSGVWSTARDAAEGETVQVPVGRLFLSAGAIALGAAIGALAAARSREAAAVAFWSAIGLLFYVYVGYPALLALLRPLLSRPVTKSERLPHVCLFIAANDEAGVIEAKIRNSLAVDYPSHLFEIVVASDGSIDGTNDIVRRFAPRVRLLEFGLRRGKIATVNDGMRTVTSEIVILSDANTFLEPGAVRALVRNFGDAQIGAVSGDVILVGERAALARSEDLYYGYERWVQRAESEIGSMIGVDGALYAIRRELFEPPAGDTILDDMAIPMAVVRAGRRVIFEPLAIAHEHGSDTAREEFARKSRVIAGAVQFLSRPDSDVPWNRKQVIFSLVSHKGLRWLSPAFGTSAFVASLVLAPSSTAYAIAVGAQFSLLVFGIAGCIPLLRRASLVAIAHYFCLVQAAAGVGFVRGLSGRQSVLWRRFNRAPMESV